MSKKEKLYYYLNVYWKGIEVHLTNKSDLACQGIHHFVVGINPYTCHNNIMFVFLKPIWDVLILTLQP